jgi:hypothetical protein
LPVTPAVRGRSSAGPGGHLSDTDETILALLAEHLFGRGDHRLLRSGTAPRLTGTRRGCAMVRKVFQESRIMTENPIRGLIAALKQEVRNGTISAATEHHLRREFAAIGWDRDPLLHAAKLNDEVRRHEIEARVLRDLRDAAFGVAQQPDAKAAAEKLESPDRPRS